MMNFVVFVWDGNEIWFVLGGVGLFVVFFLVYLVFLLVFYIGVFLMLVGFIFRGVVFEFRFKVKMLKYLWSWLFFVGLFVVFFV